MGLRHPNNSFPSDARTVGAMLRARLPARASCTTCGEWRQVDLVRLQALRGDGFSLIDRRPRCALTPGCLGRVRFFYLWGVYRPLWTDQAAQRWIAQDEAQRQRDIAADLIRESERVRNPKPRQ